MENKEVKIVRFKDGVDVICFYKTVSDVEVELTNPMMFEIRNVNLQMVHWLPVTIMKSNSVSIEKNSILCTFQPTDDFCEYYLHVTDKLSSVDKEDDKEELEQIMDALSELETTKGIPIH